MLCEIPWGACPFSKKVSQAKRISCCCATLFLPCFLRCGNPAVPQLNERRLSPLFCGRHQSVGDLRDMPALKRDRELIFGRLA